MYAAWGTIVFQLLTSPTSFDGTASYDFAKQKPVLARPVLQWIGEDLEQLELSLLFHQSFCDPQSQMDALRAAAKAHRAAALVFGSGVYRGYYVISKIRESPIKQADDGTVIAVSADVTFTECPKTATAGVTGSLPPLRQPLALVAGGSQPTLATTLSPTSPSGTLPSNSVLELKSLPLGSFQPVFSLPGSSALGSVTGPSGPSGPQLQANDVPLTSVVRAE